MTPFLSRREKIIPTPVKSTNRTRILTHIELQKIIFKGLLLEIKDKGRPWRLSHWWVYPRSPRDLSIHMKIK